MGVFASVGGWLMSAVGGEEERVVSHAIGLVGTQLREVPDYQERMRPALDHAMAYCDRLVAGIPGPLVVSDTAYAGDPRLQALFPSAAEIGVALGRSLAIKETLAHYADGRHGDLLFSLLGMRKRRISGDESGPLPVADHTFRSLGADEAETRRRVREAAFDGLLIGFAGRWKELCRGQSRAATERRLESELARQSAADGRASSIHEEHLRQAAQQPTPEHMLDALCEWLSFPEEQLRMAGSMDSGGLSLPVLVGRDRRHWPVCVAKVKLEEVLEAAARETRVHRYILI